MTTWDLPTYSEEEIRDRLEDELPAWEYRGGWLQREVPAGSRPRALLVAAGLAYRSEAAFHHPDLQLRGDGVLIQVRHHWAAGITDADFELAHALEAVLGRMEPPGRPSAGGDE